MIRSFYEKNLLVMGIEVVVGLLLWMKTYSFFGNLGHTGIGKFVLLYLLLSCLKVTLASENIVLIKK